MKPFYHPETGVPGVRFATPADEDQIFALLMLLHSENGMFGVNDDKVREGIKIATRRKGGFIWVIDEGGRVVATMGMLTGTATTSTCWSGGTSSIRSIARATMPAC
jgi:hypothetical protein